MENSTMKQMNKRLSQSTANATQHLSRPLRVVQYACGHPPANQVCAECLAGGLAAIEQRINQLEKEMIELSHCDDGEG